MRTIQLYVLICTMICILGTDSDSDFGFGNQSMAYAYDIPSNLWQGLIAEATSDGYDGMYAVACCVRNRLERGMDIGLCGIKRKDLNEFCKREGKERERQAKEIVDLVFNKNSKDVTLGATFFENVEKYGLQKWLTNQGFTTKIGEHSFYRP